MENIHPMTVHFTIGLFMAAVFFELFGKMLSKESLRIAGRWNLLVALLCAILSVSTGLYAESTAPHSGQVHEMLEKHEALGITVLVIVVVMNIYNLFLKKRLKPIFDTVYIVIGIAGLVVISFGAYYGGEMVYRYGVGVKAIVVEEESGGHDHSAHSKKAAKKDDGHGGHEH